MDIRVTAFLEKEKEESIKREYQKKIEILSSFDLVEREYSPYDYRTEEYDYSVWDERAQKDRYYKYIPLEVSDDEYEEIKKIYDEKNRDVKATNTIATAVMVIAYITFICGFIAGIVLGNAFKSSYYDDFNAGIMFVTWIYSAISGTFILGFAEVIKLLQAIKDK